MKKQSKSHLKWILFNNFDSYNFPDKIALAVSGGPDSMAMVSLLNEWVQHNGKFIHCLIVNHKLRPESDHEIIQVCDCLSSNGISHTVLVWENGKNVKKDIQNKARQARFDLMTGWCLENNCSVLMFAHHLNDQLETFLMRLSKGTDIKGLAAIRRNSEYNNIKIIRPFLTYPSRVLRGFIKEQYEYICDPSNYNLKFERVRYRKAIQNLIEAGFDLQNFELTIQKIQEIDECIQDIINDVLEKAVVFKNDQGWILNYDIVKSLKFPIFKRFFLYIFDKVVRDRSLRVFYDKIQKNELKGITLAGYYIRYSNSNGVVSVTYECKQVYNRKVKGFIFMR